MVIVLRGQNALRSRRILWILDELRVRYEVAFYQRDARTNGWRAAGSSSPSIRPLTGALPGRKQLDLRHLRYIVASARNGSFSAAAHEFNVRPPIVSKRIKQVEDELGVRHRRRGARSRDEPKERRP